MMSISGATSPSRRALAPPRTATSSSCTSTATARRPRDREQALAAGGASERSCLWSSQMVSTTPGHTKAPSCPRRTGLRGRCLEDVLSAGISRRHGWWVGSLRGSMAWDIACYRGEAFSAVPASGGFWSPYEAYASPVSLRHTHGTADTVVPWPAAPSAQPSGRY